MRKVVLTLLLTMAGLAGCLNADDSPEDGSAEGQTPHGFVDLASAALMPAVFKETVVDAAVSFASDLYEPTIDVSDSGVIYIAGHTIGVDTTGAPAFFSRDDGTTWAQLPFLGPLTMPEPLHSATPPPSDEIFIVAGDDGWAYGVDITLLTYPVNAWSGDGAALSYHNPDAYDEVQALYARTPLSCGSLSLNDRPWAAYANGTLLLVNNPGGGPVQVGVMDVPLALPVGAPPVNGFSTPEWNLCASPGGYIPGIPDIRDDGLFAVPQVESQNDRLVVVLGDRDNIMHTEVREVVPFTSAGTITTNYGQAVFDEEGTLFIGVGNNTFDVESTDSIIGPPGTRNVPRDGRFILAASTDGGQTFMNRTFATPGIVQSLYIDGNMAGEGALVVWAVAGNDTSRSDWYIGHAYVGPDGAPYLTHVALAIDEGPRPSAHVTGAAVGPDGRAYLATYKGGGFGSTPLSVWVQQEGATLATA